MTSMKTATYTLLDGTDCTIEYDADAPCIYCRLPVIEASMGGTVVCSWCDCGVHRDGRKWTFDEAKSMGQAAHSRYPTIKPYMTDNED